MIKLIQLFYDEKFFKRIRIASTKNDKKIIPSQIEAKLYFNAANTIRRDIVFLINQDILLNYFDELHRLSVTNFIVYVYTNENEIIGNKKVENLSDHYLRYDFTNIDLYTTLSLSAKALQGHTFTIFPRKLINTSVSEIEQLINNVSQRVFWKNTNGQYIGCNQKFISDFELDNVEDIVGKSDLELFEEKYALEFSAYDSQILKTAKATESFEKEIAFSNGEKKWLKFKKYPHLKEGVVIGIIGVYEIIDNEIHSEDLIFSDQHLLEVLMDSIPDTIYFKDKESCFVKVNKAQCDLFGIESPDEAIGKTDFDFCNADFAKEAFTAEQQIIFDGVPQNKLEYIEFRDGKYRWMNSLKSPIKDEKGNTIGIVGISRDVDDMISARKQLKTENDILQLLIDNIPIPVFFKDTNSNFTRVNVALVELMGAQKINEVIGKNDYYFYDKEVADAFLNDEKMIFASGEPLFNKIESYNIKSNNIKWLSTTKIPLKDKTGKPTGLIGISNDVTEQMAIKKSLEFAKQKAEEASQAKSNFLSNMSHEIRTPLNGIIGMADVLSHTELESEQVKMVDILLRSGNNLLRIINDILDISKIEAGKLILENSNLSLSDLIENVNELMTLSALENNINLSSKIDSNIPDLLLGDSHRIKQVLLNLVSNAIKFSQNGSVKIEAKTLGYSDDKQCIQFSVRDTGIGMDVNEAQHIFESFTQADSSTTRKYGGTGLGLTISHRLVEMMGGKLKVHSKKGEGSIFYFELFFDRATIDEHNYL